MPQTLLILTANPDGSAPLNLEQEVVIITQALQPVSEQFVVKQQWAVTPSEVRKALLAHQPTFVHFSGHGSGEQGIVLQNVDDQPQLVSTEALANLFKPFSKIRCVILNACFSAFQASAIVKHVPFVIGMNLSVSDKAAILFSTAFYETLGAESAIETAFELGCNAIELEGLREHVKTALKRRFDTCLENMPVGETLHFHGTAGLGGLE